MFAFLNINFLFYANFLHNYNEIEELSCFFILFFEKLSSVFSLALGICGGEKVLSKLDYK